jgi:hypothetical protein
MPLLEWKTHTYTVRYDTIVAEIGMPRNKDKKTMYTGMSFRVDPLLSGRGFHVDMCTLGPWEGIDGGIPCATSAEGKALAEAYYSAILEQGTCHPRMPKRS